jgi:hypothetical protein
MTARALVLLVLCLAVACLLFGAGQHLIGVAVAIVGLAAAMTWWSLGGKR